MQQIQPKKQMSVSEMLTDSNEAIRQVGRMVSKFSTKVMAAKNYVNQLVGISDNERVKLNDMIDEICIAAIGRTTEEQP